tara:strand:- start:835 stop:2328 length:1494 start_codon:yes stop_codon:yes gene_type:complete
LTQNNKEFIDMVLELQVENIRYKNVERFLSSSHIELENIQSYFPSWVMDTHLKFSKWNTIHLNNRLIDVISKNQNNYSGLIVSCQGGEAIHAPFHIKSTPIIEPRTFFRYKSSNSSHLVPGNYNKWKNTIDKVHSVSNTAYIDTLCSIYLSRLKEFGLTPHFGSIYGIYSGIIKDFEEDVSEEYSIINDENWLMSSIQKNKIRIKHIPTNQRKFEAINDLEVCDLDMYAVQAPNGITPSTDEDDDAKHIIIYPEVPVQIVFMEKFDITLDNLLKDSINRVRIPTRYSFVRYIRKIIVINKLKAWIFQITAGLHCANKYIQFVHNDLHVQNVMGKKTNQKYIFYKQSDIIYKIPTYGYIMNIIDFGRSTFQVNNKQYIGDVFDDDGDAGGQYSLVDGVHPHPAFDLARLACSFIEDLDESFWPTKDDLDNYDIGSLINSWTYDDNGQSLLDIEGFELYIHIAKYFRTKTPKRVLQNATFHSYIVDSNIDITEKNTIPL